MYPRTLLGRRLYALHAEIVSLAVLLGNRYPKNEGTGQPEPFWVYSSRPAEFLGGWMMGAG